MQETSAVLSRYLGVETWRQEFAANIFPTKGSREWFFRIHGDELEEKEAIIKRKGRAGDLVDIERIGPVIQSILKRESRKTALAAA